jgi:hypothetical protein
MAGLGKDPVSLPGRDNHTQQGVLPLVNFVAADVNRLITDGRKFN